ncbi:co-chaperone YbbN [Microbacterium sp. MYb64]|uniref:thioredoxin family protein n=1 Tax=Microbacterium sp. MYb64 TaxID=1848691 RepID=UPI000CFAFA6A|nr:thioredoxin family protein [Microbacterium sp. MYb64]PRB00970.1 thiol reductase thioredoxin [Microbacterium sp. MYb64]
MPVLEANSATLQSALEGESPVIIQFWAEWCAPCRAMIPIVDQFAAERGASVTVARVDVDANPDLSLKYRVTAVPTFAIAQGDTMLSSFSGAMPLHAFAERVDKALS